MGTNVGFEMPGYILRKTVNFLPSRSLRRAYLVGGLLFPILIAIGCRLDGTWTMSGSGKGFAQYYGFWAIFVTTPITLLLTSYLFDTFNDAIRKPEKYCVDLTDEARARIERLVQRHTQSLSLRSRSAWILVFMMIVLFLWWLFNVINTLSPPLSTFHHDVFDSAGHPFGFYATKTYLFFLYVFVYAPAVFLAMHVTASMISILKFLCRDEVLRINFFHPDNCGGTSLFGKINLIILSIYLNFFAVIYAQYVTHRQTYLVITVSLIACSLLAAAQSVAGVYYIHKAVAQKKRESIQAVTERLNQQFASSLQPGGKFPNDLLAFRNHLMSVHTFPYTKGALVGVNIIRFAPAALAVLSFLRPQ
jgi:hypothetical protein